MSRGISLNELVHFFAGVGAPSDESVRQELVSPGNEASRLLDAVRSATSAGFPLASLPSARPVESGVEVHLASAGSGKLISKADIQARNAQLGRAIRSDYRHRDLTVVGILKGACHFSSDLVRQVRLPLRMEFIQSSSYRTGTVAGELVINDAFHPDVAGRDVLLVDDIIDTGATLAAFTKRILEWGARSVRVAVLLKKRGTQVFQVPLDYVGFTIPNVFVVGYGLDHNGLYRELPYVRRLDQDQDPRHVSPKALADPIVDWSNPSPKSGVDAQLGQIHNWPPLTGPTVMMGMAHA
jgi:hypoxanthine phosphoribosyltransferase